MSSAVISVENLGKKYLLRHQAAGLRYTALRDVIAERAVGLFKRLKSENSKNLKSENLSASQHVSVSAFQSSVSSTEAFWALRDVSFEVRQGEVVGIIGRNGAGKSTLLKILSQITEPTTGRVRIRGRVASLLEVGTGFHPELTGRENIFLNGAILGMSRVEIKRKFDEIVAFAEIEKFLDTPVKHYSSGMYVRLAFAVAAHLEPEILVVDEVLAVGDAEFQRKCLGKMHEVSKGGRTVLFVSHNMAAVQNLCCKAVYLQSGEIRGFGEVGPWVAKYLSEARAGGCRELSGPLLVDQNLEVRALELSPNPVEAGRSVRFRVELLSHRPARLSELALLLYTQTGSRVGVLDFRPFGLPLTLASGQPWELCGEIPSLPLVEGDYSAGLYLNAGEFCGDLLDLVSLNISPRRAETGHVPYPAVNRGVLDLDFVAEPSNAIGG